MNVIRSAASRAVHSSLEPLEQRVDVAIARDRLRVLVLPALAPPIRIGFDGEVVELAGGASKEWPLPPGDRLAPEAVDVQVARP